MKSPHQIKEEQLASSTSCQICEVLSLFQSLSSKALRYEDLTYSMSTVLIYKQLLINVSILVTN